MKVGGWGLLAWLLTCQVLAADATGVLSVYEANRRQGLPNYVTQDALLVAYQDLSRQDQRAREAVFRETLLTWLAQLSEQSTAQETEAEALLFARDLLVVLDVLRGEPELALSERAAAELAFVREAGGIGESPLWQVRVDASQYQARGYYTETTELARYFVLARYLNSNLFALTASAATGVSEQLTRTYLGAVDYLISWSDQPLYAELLELAADLGGQADDLSLLDIAAAGDAGSRATRVQALVGEGARWLGEGEPPVSAAQSSRGWLKGYPLANEVFAALGVAEAQRQLVASGDDQFENYGQEQTTASASFKDRPAAEQLRWNLYQQIASSREDAASGLISARAMWSLQRHQDVLYAKQSYSLVERSLVLPADRGQSTLEPAPAVYAALAELVQQRLENAPPLMASPWQGFAELVARLAAMATLLSGGESLTDDDNDFLADIDLLFKELAIEPDQPRVVDVHTHAGEAKVLQQATGLPRLVMAGDARGAMLSHHEFKRPLAERLTDSEWQESLRQAL